jgi:hypothetical protein
MSQKLVAATAMTLFIASAVQAAGAPANTLPELWRELGTCVRAPTESVGSELTMVFALKRDGSLLGQPKIVHSYLLGDASAQHAFVSGVIKALAKCLPMSITDGLGRAIAGHPISMRVGRRPKETDV